MGIVARALLALAAVIFVVDILPTFSNYLGRCMPERAIKERYIHQRRADQADYTFQRFSQMFQDTVHEVNEGCWMPALMYAGRESAFFAAMRTIAHSNMMMRFLAPQDRYEYIAAAILWMVLGTGVFYLVRDCIITWSAERLKTRKIEAGAQKTELKAAARANLTAATQSQPGSAQFILQTPSEFFKPRPVSCAAIDELN